MRSDFKLLHFISDAGSVGFNWNLPIRLPCDK